MPDPRSVWDMYSVSITKVPGTAITLIMAAILLPAAFYGFNLMMARPTPADVLVSICISLFSAVLFLWILDAVSILPFRSQWVSKSIYGAAIVSVLGTSVAVYKDYFAARKYPYEGSWVFQYLDAAELKRTNLIMLYSDQSGAYWGYSELDNADPKDKDPIIWVKVDEFDPNKREIRLQLHRASRKLVNEKYQIAIERENKLITSAKPADDKLRLSRPN